MSVHKLNFTFKRGKIRNLGLKGLVEPFTSRATVHILTRFFCITLQKMKNNTTEKWKSNHNWHFTSYVKTKNKNKTEQTNQHENPKFEKGLRSSAILWRSVECADVELCASLLTVWRNAELTFGSANQDAGAEHGPVQWSSCKCFHCGWKQMRRGVASMRFTNQISINVTESANSRLWLRSGNDGSSVRVRWKVLSTDSCTCYKYLF